MINYSLKLLPNFKIEQEPLAQVSRYIHIKLLGK